MGNKQARIQTSDRPKGKLKNVYIHVAGKTLGSHISFVKKLRGAHLVKTPEESDVTIVFCPIVSRFETDINEALSSASEARCGNVILVAMHHTFKKNYILPNGKQPSDPAVILLVQCLFFEKQGLLSCPCNKRAIKEVKTELELKSCGCLSI